MECAGCRNLTILKNNIIKCNIYIQNIIKIHYILYFIMYKIKIEGIGIAISDSRTKRSRKTK